MRQGLHTCLYCCYDSYCKGTNFFSIVYRLATVLGLASVHSPHRVCRVRHNIATLGDSTIGRATLTIAQHGIISLGSIVYPSIEVTQHAGVDSREEIEEVFVEIVVTCIVLNLIPVDEILGHPHLLAFLAKILVGTLNATILMATIAVEVVYHVCPIECIGMVVAHSKCFRSHYLATDLTPIGLDKLGHLTSIP